MQYQKIADTSICYLVVSTISHYLFLLIRQG